MVKSLKLLDKILKGDAGTASMLMRDIEDEIPGVFEELRNLYPHTGRAYVIGVTGAPGVGKSTLIDALIRQFCQSCLTVGVIAIDPTSPFTGGAILGDRIRMKHIGDDQGVFIRSVATRGWSGGLSKSTLSMIHVMDAMGKDVVLVETVGTGQVEIDVTKVADVSLVILCPGGGDEIQAMKGGILEAADIIVVNKADKEGADNLKLKVEMMLGMRVYGSGHCRPCVLSTRATNGGGVAELQEEIFRYRDFLTSTGTLMVRRRQRAKTELYEIIRTDIERYIDESISKDALLDTLVDDIALRKADPYSAGSEITCQLIKKISK